MTAAELLGKTLKNHEKWKIYDGGRLIFAGWGYEICDDFFPGRRTELYERIKDREVGRLSFETEIRHRNWKELGLDAPLMPDEAAQMVYKDLQENVYYVLYLDERKGGEDG